jgi:hypothetical protein
LSNTYKLDPVAKQHKAARLALLRTTLRFKNRDSYLKATAIMAELRLIHKASHLTAKTKHALFQRGAKQLSELQFKEELK